MEYMKFKTKTDDIITWLSVNDVGSLSVVLEGIISQGQVEGQTEKDYENYWASIRSLCGTLPNSPIRKGIPTSVPAQVQAVVDSVMNRVQTAFAGIGDIELILDTVMPMRNAKGTKFQTADELGEYFANRVSRLLMDSYKAKLWNGELTKNNTTGLELPVKESSEDSE
tara:strand:+ start:238 stop:741 length:504 start_codon:yes stop_codon:yes gene_type:complete